MTFTDKHGWLLNVEIALPLEQLQNAARYAYKVNLQRMIGMSVGDQKDRARRALVLLQRFIEDKREHGPGKIQQRIIGHGYPFRSTERLRPDRTFFLPEVSHGR